MTDKCSGCPSRPVPSSVQFRSSTGRRWSVDGPAGHKHADAINGCGLAVYAGTCRELTTEKKEINGRRSFMRFKYQFGRRRRDGGSSSLPLMFSLLIPYARCIGDFSVCAPEQIKFLPAAELAEVRFHYRLASDLCRVRESLLQQVSLFYASVTENLR